MRQLTRFLMILPALMLHGAAVQAADGPVRLNRVITQVEQGQSVIGLIIGNRSVETGRMLRDSGLDFIVIDMEHQVYDFTAVRDVILGLYEQPFAADVTALAKQVLPASNTPPFFPPRPPPVPLAKLPRLGIDQIPLAVRQAVKLGALGVFIPFTESRAQIEAAAEAAMYPESSYIPWLSDEDWQARNNPWPLNPRGEILVGAMIESLQGEANIDEILDTPGLGMVWLAHPSSEAVAEDIRQKCIARKILVDGGTATPRMEFLGWDRDVFYQGLGEALKTAGKALGRNDR